MYILKNTQHHKRIVIINPGEYYVSDKDEIISTVLGSCVAVCLYDTVSGVAGMNHFVLPGKIAQSDILGDKTTKFGITAINKLIGKIHKIGAQKDTLKAKIYGGGHILNKETDVFTIPMDNIRVAKLLIELEDIPIEEVDVGKNYTRKVFMDVKSGNVHLEKTTKADYNREMAMYTRKSALKRLGIDGNNNGIL